LETKKVKESPRTFREWDRRIALAAKMMENVD